MSLADQTWSPSINDTNKQALEKDIIMTSNKEPRIGVGVFVMNAEGKFVLGKRKGSHGASESLPLPIFPHYAFPYTSRRSKSSRAYHIL
jgi:hypothetical protein